MFFHFRCVYFDPDGSCLYSGVKDFLKVYGWEPAQCFDSVPITWGEVIDMSTTAQNQLVGLIVYNFAGTWQNLQNELCIQQRLKSAWASAQSDQRLRWAHEKALGP